MKRFIIFGLLSGMLGGATWAGTTPLYENFGTLTNTPQIDATAFANYGSFSVASILPFDFLNTRYFTNSSVMSGLPGYRFDYLNDAGVRQFADTFVNDTGSSISADDFSSFLVAQGIINIGGSFENAAIYVGATNVANQGLLSASADGLIHIEGKNVDLSYGELEVRPFNPSPGGGFCQTGGGSFSTPTNFIPEASVLDALWSLNTNVPYRVTGLFSTNADGTVFIASPVIRLPPPQFGTFQLILPSAHAFVFTNKVSDSNYVVQAVFVQDSDTNITSRVRFAQSAEGNNPARTAVVAMTTTATNIVTGQTINYSAYVLDYLLSSSNYVLLTNVATGTTFRPSALTVTRVTPCEYFTGRPTNSPLRPDLFYSPPIDLISTNLINTNPPPNFDPTNILSIVETNEVYATNAVTNFNATYVAELTETATTVPGAAATNQPGRVDIFADNLNLNRVKIRGENLVSVHTKNLVGNSQSFISVPVLNYELGATNGQLAIRGLVPTDVRVFNGFVETWSGIWTNQIFITNNIITPDTNVPPNFTTNTTTSTIEVDYEILLVLDALTTSTPLVVNDFITHSTNVTIYDKLQVNGALNVDALGFTVTNGGAFTISGVQNWDATVFPNLRYLTNEGAISIPNVATFGSASRPYASIENQGSCSAFGQLIWADQFDNGGLMSANATLTLTAGSAKLDGGRFSAGNDLLIKAGYVKLRNYNISCATLNLTVTNSLADNGGGASNVIQCRDGFNLLLKPVQGDLFGTTIQDVVPAGGAVQHVWAGQDLGPNAAGFSNNVVIGKLVLNADANSLLSFTGTGASNALYVDYLELDGAMTNNLDAVLAIDPNLVIYYADANLPPDTFLTNKAGGRLQWVSSFVGPNSSIAVVLHSTGQTVLMNRSLRYSKTIDSDGDGIPNFYDPTPLDFNDSVLTSSIALNVALTSQPSPTVVLSWQGSAGAVYQVQSTPTLTPANWQVVATYTNNAAGGVGTFQDAVASGPSQRYYRVKLVQ